MIDFEKIGRAAVIAVYKDTPEAPKGYEFTGVFTVPRLGEWYLANSGRTALDCLGEVDKPRLILRRKMVKREVGATYRRLGRPPLPGEFYESPTVTPGCVSYRVQGSSDEWYRSAKAEALSREVLYVEEPEPTE